MTNDNNNLKSHVFGLLGTLHELPSKLSLLQRSPRLENVAGSDEFQRIERWAIELKTFIDQTFSELYRRIAMHTDAIVQLTDDRRVAVPVKKLGKLTMAEYADLRECAGQIENVSDVGDFLTWALKWGDGAAKAIQVRRAQILAATAELETYFSSAA
ncbi:hypothetical protein [Mycobacterium noviomagense]|uniref:Uncharacterized protein n=1 Tax=Mycobacterium noviomagense TaxID=459858 RepID=A0A7I7PBQ1_9MYCO|nr:hypothetical protein [Mycobacterium noviomagense]ORB11641.1 hypothetical protein BST37_18740 [Mycobacterium noviomagense]BBY06027.1 hypothetical protein MNVI_13450 [Mycobacterium noviomagense]